jgi:hypothetical protein
MFEDDLEIAAMDKMQFRVIMTSTLLYLMSPSK